LQSGEPTRSAFKSTEKEPAGDGKVGAPFGADGGALCMDQPKSLDLEHLAHEIRKALNASQQAGATVWHRRFEAGEALIAAESQVPAGEWKKWLRANCFLSVRTAFRYVQLARKRDEIEAILAEGKELSLNAAIRRFSKPKTKKAEVEADEITEIDEETLVAALKVGGVAYFTSIVLSRLPPEWLPAIELRVTELIQKSDTKSIPKTTREKGRGRSLRLVHDAGDGPTTH
jgi:hypothetical protein